MSKSHPGACTVTSAAMRGLESSVLVVEEPDPAGQFAHREVGLRLDRVGMVVCEPAGPTPTARRVRGRRGAGDATRRGRSRSEL